MNSFYQLINGRLSVSVIFASELPFEYVSCCAKLFEVIMHRFFTISILSALFAVLFFHCDNSSQEILVDITDSSFLGGLIAAGVDTDGDGQISYPEAEAIRSIILPPSGITDLSGLEAFLNLDSLVITLNPLAGIDLSANSSLRYLECTGCELTELDISRNLALEVLICGRNKLPELNVSQNLSLVKLICNNNLLSELDLSANTGLVTMISCGNRLTHLDISKNAALQKIGFDNMPMLTEVCVWTLPFPPPGVTTLQDYSPNVSFTLQCSGS
jgi:Leucine-rich repeat (LRR) protein